MSPFLKICVLVLLIGAVCGTPLNREKRRSRLGKWYDKTKSYVKHVAHSLKSGIVHAYKYVRGTVKEEAKAFLEKQGDTEHKGKNILARGRNMLILATQISGRIVEDIGKASKEKIDDAVQKLTKVALAAIKTGQRILDKSQNITTTLRHSGDQIGAVLQESLPEVGDAVKEVADSISEAGVALMAVGGQAGDAPDDVLEAMEEVEQTVSLVADAGLKMKEVGKDSLNLYHRVVEMGQDIGKVLADAAKDIAKITGVTGKKR